MPWGHQVRLAAAWWPSPRPAHLGSVVDGGEVGLGLHPGQQHGGVRLRTGGGKEIEVEMG